MTSTKEGSASLQKAVEKALHHYLAPLSPEEISKVKQYELERSVYPYHKILKQPKLAKAYDVNPFAVPDKHAGTPFLKKVNVCSFLDYYRVASDSFITDSALHFLQRHILQQIDGELRKGVRFCINVATGGLTDPNNTQLKENGAGFANADTRDNTYNGFFGKDVNSFLDWKRIYLPFHYNSNHFVGAIVHPRDNKVATFDHYGKFESSHKEIFIIVSTMLNHALRRENRLANHSGWKHEILTVPKQSDTISCGIFQAINGIILTLFDDVSVAKGLLVNQDQIVKFIRPKLKANILNLFRLTKTPEDLIRDFKLVKEVLENNPKKKASLEKKKGQQAKKHPTKEESADKSPSESSNKRKRTLSPLLQKALASTGPFQFPANADTQIRSKLLQSEAALKFPTLFHAPPNKVIENCFERRNVPKNQQQLQKFQTQFREYLMQFNRLCVQVLCLQDMAVGFWSRLLREGGEAVLPTFAKYLSDTLIHMKRACLILDNGRPIVGDDRQQVFHCLDWLYDSGRRKQEFLQKYSCINIKKVLKEPRDSDEWFKTMGGWTTQMYDTINIIRGILDSFSKYLPTSMTASTVKNCVVVKYNMAGETKSLSRQVDGLALNDDEYTTSSCSMPVVLGVGSYRFHQLKLLYNSCKATMTAVPDVLLQEMQDKFESVEFEERKKLRKTLVLSDDSGEEYDHSAMLADDVADNKSARVEKKHDDSMSPDMDKEEDCNTASETSEGQKEQGRVANEAVPTVGSKSNANISPDMDKPDDCNTAAETNKGKEAQGRVANEAVASVGKNEKVTGVPPVMDTKLADYKDKSETMKGKNAQSQDVILAKTRSKKRHNGNEGNASSMKRRTLVDCWGSLGSGHIQVKFLNKKSTSTKRKSGPTTVEDEGICFTRNGAKVLIDSAETFEGQETAEMKPSKPFDADDETGYFEDKAAKDNRGHNIIVLPKKHHKEADEICVYSKIQNPCNLLKKTVNNTAILRDDSSIFKNICFYNAKEFNIIEVDNIEVCHHMIKNESTAKVMVRVTFPTNEEHDLIRTLQSQLDIEEYTAMLNATKGVKADDMVLIAFVTMYDNQSMTRAKVVEQLIFHSFIVMTKPISSSDDNMKVNYAWTSDAYGGATLGRLMQIGCIVYWKEPRQLTVDAPKEGKFLVPSHIKWKMCRETAFDIIVRLYGHRSIPMPKSKALDVGLKKTNDMTSVFIGHLRRLLKPNGETKVAATVKIPLAVFTHHLSQRGQYITELAAELFQDAVLLAKRNGHLWSFTFHCTCCDSAMNSPLDFVDMISVGTRIIMVHKFNSGVCDGDFLKQCNMDKNWAPLGKVKMDQLPESLQIYPCQPKLDWNLTWRRMLLFDAGKVDNGSNSNELQKRNANAISLSSALLPTNVTAVNTDRYPLVYALFHLIQELLFGKKSPNNLSEDDSSNESMIDMDTIKEGRPLQVKITDIQVDPISSLKQHPSWQKEKEQVESGTIDIAKYNGEVPMEVGSLETDNPTISAYEIRDGRGDGVLHMLSYYYAKYIISIDKGSSFDDVLKKMKKTAVKLPSQLQKFMTKVTTTSTFLVVITDVPQKNNLSKAMSSSSMGTLANPLIHKLTWFVPSHFFLTMFPKNEVDGLLAGTIQHISINKETRLKFQTPVMQSLKHQFRQIKLHSECPRPVYEVILTGAKKTKIYINAKDQQEYMQNISEPWLAEKLSSICNVSGSFGVTIGAGKKSVRQLAVSQSDYASNFWCDKRNKNNLCVAGGIANWLHAAGCNMQASSLREWAESKNVLTNDEGESINEALQYMLKQLHIGSVKINLVDDLLSLEDTVALFRSFPAPCNLLFSCLSSHQTHSLVVSEKIVYDLQDSCPYELTLSGLKRKLCGHNDVVSLVGAHYLFVHNGKKVTVPNCPTGLLDINLVHIPYYGTLIKSLGSRSKYMKKKKKKKKGTTSIRE